MLCNGADVGGIQRFARLHLSRGVMNIGKPNDLRDEKVTEPKDYFSRRNFIRAGVLAASAAGTAALYRSLAPGGSAIGQTAGDGVPPPLLSDIIAGATTAPTTASAQDPKMLAAFKTTEKANTLEQISHYNNFYEFSTGKQQVAEVAKGFVTQPWTVAIEGACRKPRVLDFDEVLKLSPPEE